MEKPKILMKANVPMSDTGIVTAGMMVARQSCRKRKMTMMTMMIASPMVETTSLTDSLMTVVVSTAMAPGAGKRRSGRRIPQVQILDYLSSVINLAG